MSDIPDNQLDDIIDRYKMKVVGIQGAPLGGARAMRVKEMDDEVKAGITALIDKAREELAAEIIAAMPAIDMNAWPREQWMYNSEPLGQLNATYQLHQFINKALFKHSKSTN